MNLLDIVLYFTAAAMGSAINAVAGGGTFLVFPLLIVSGVGSVAANVTSTVALWPGTVASAFAYKSERNIEKSKFLPLIIISALGSIIGTAILLLTPEKTFSALVPWLLLVATLIFTFGKYLLPKPTERPATKAAHLAAMALQLAIAIYGGYFGAGQGILMLAMLQLMGMTLIHQMNALKTVLGSTINAVAVAIFIFSGRVVWDVAAIMIAGAIVGGYFGARLSLRVSPQKIRLIVSAIGFAMSTYFFLYGV